MTKDNTENNPIHPFRSPYPPQPPWQVTHSRASPIDTSLPVSAPPPAPARHRRRASPRSSQYSSHGPVVTRRSLRSRWSRRPRAFSASTAAGCEREAEQRDVGGLRPTRSPALAARREAQRPTRSRRRFLPAISAGCRRRSVDNGTGRCAGRQARTRCVPSRPPLVQSAGRSFLRAAFGA